MDHAKYEAGQLRRNCAGAGLVGYMKGLLNRKSLSPEDRANIHDFITEYEIGSAMVKESFDAP